MKIIVVITALFFAAVLTAPAQDAKAKAPTQDDITGLYSFVHEGEFVQIEVSHGKVSGLVSSFKDGDPEKAEFVDAFFADAKLDGTTLTFRTKPMGGSYFEFSGMVERDPGKKAGDEGYYVVKGTLITHRTEEGKSSEKSEKLTLRSFPQDADAGQSAPAK